MNSVDEQAGREANSGLNQVHRFGSASESLFRRLYAALSRRRQLEDELRQARAQASQAASQHDDLRGRHQRLQSQHQRRGSDLERLRAMLGSLDEGIIAQDNSGKVTMMNRAAESMLGGKRAFWESDLGRLFERYQDLRETDAELRLLGDSQELPLNNHILRAQLVAIGGDDGQRIGTIIILRDVTHDALARRLQDGFARHIAEDMQRPISILKLASELLSGQPEDRDINQRLLEKLLQNVDALDQLALELLDIARMKADSFEVKREPLDAEAMLWSVANGIGPELRQRGIDLLVMTRGIRGLSLRGDQARLQWALGHLIRNGADYNKDGGYVALAAREETRQARRYLLISVSDDGAGISSADMPHIFERFYRGGSSAGQEQASGLGQSLYVARAICDAHGGGLEARSRAGIGSIFTMAVPIV